MIDEHIMPLSADYGLRPVLFHIGNIPIPSYTFFLLLAIFVGLLMYVYESRKENRNGEYTFFIAIGALIGATLGAKIPIWIMHYELILQNWPNPYYILSGRTITGALIGGPIGVFVTKKLFGITEKRGNIFAPALALGDSIGRFGCLLRGCCHGIETNLPWGIDFGDGIIRHPTQLYESIFAFLLFLYLIYIKKTKKDLKAGELFRTFMNCYFVFRFFIEFIRTEQVLFWGLTVFQVLSVCVLIFYNRREVVSLFSKIKKN